MPKRKLEEYLGPKDLVEDDRRNTKKGVLPVSTYLTPDDKENISTTNNADVNQLQGYTETVAALQSQLSTSYARIAVLESQINELTKSRPSTNSDHSTIRSDPKTPSTATTNLSTADIAEKINKSRTLANREITKQLKWVPSCKRGTARFSCTTAVPSEEVFLAMFKPHADSKGKKWKQKKIKVEELEGCVGSIESRIRYGYLRITGSEVMLKWNAEDRMFTISGTYGL